jgi:hypothetical protein
MELCPFSFFLIGYCESEKKAMDIRIPGKAAYI